ncbi:MAG: glycosyltransferase family A protein [Rhodopila sp.]|nr:glycosyltransferase family A protein [Rhodopila sp.]
MRGSPVDNSNIVVAIPVRDEAARIRPCLIALNQQMRVPDGVVLMLNNCTDETETITRAMIPKLRFPLDIISRDLPLAQADAGHARGLAMDVAAERAGSSGVLLTTDADSTVPPDWVIRNLASLRQGVDIVCGRAVIDPIEAAVIPAHLHADDALECRLIALLDDVAWMLDPEPHDPPLRHTEASGATLAVTVAAFHRVGGIPAMASGEDRAFVRALWMMDARVRHDPTIQVTVSGRVEGRAPGGMADAIRRRIVQQDEFADEMAEPAMDAYLRYSLRQRVRRVWRGLADPALAGDLGLSWAKVATAVADRYFGGAWAKLEAASPVLQRRRVRFTELPAEIETARMLRHRLTTPETLAAD